MSRQPRRLSASGYMHIIVRGVGKQILFEEDADYRYFLKILARFCGETAVKICAYCLMENHVHLLVCDEKGQTPLMMKKLGVSYSYYFNKKYERTGHLFQDRYLSENVEDEAYFLTVFRYILNNPKKAGLCSAAVYPWNSYAAYSQSSTLVDVSMARKLLGDKANYDAFLSADNKDECLEYESVKRDDAWVKAVIRDCLGDMSATTLKSCDKKTRDEALRRLKQKGLTLSQIERATGINRNSVQRA